MWPILWYLSFIVVFQTFLLAFPQIFYLFCLFTPILDVFPWQDGSLSLPPSTSQTPSLEDHTSEGQEEKPRKRR
jgi:hypothetical protein